MVDFTLTDQQRNIRELAHDFAEKEIRPVAWDYDRDATWPEEIIRKAWDVGLMNSQPPSPVETNDAAFEFSGMVSIATAARIATTANTLHEMRMIAP